ncbi:ETS-related transcription factor Elf-5-like isoform X2 [Aphidius gifuensis]|uniref:ETS-related transcription factor Elf-5-like isoform X2 n=1 Tax=Aphidius gifuensis TaxID=684658 RepID=UPI001CDD1AA4|nr:ETS-related transcription factor Elf-5-like isoform X2 [Aphidius gifuensis]
MSASVNYQRDQLEPYYLMRPSQEEDPFILDMDSIGSKQNSVDRRVCETLRKQCSLGEGTSTASDNDWLQKPIKDWNQADTTSWLMVASQDIGQPYNLIPPGLVVPGRNLITMSKREFMDHDPIYGDKLYESLISQSSENYLLGYSSSQSILEDDHTQTGSTTVSDAESEDSVEMFPKRQGPGRPKGVKQKKPSTSQGKLWEFIRDLLRNRETCPSLICWEDYSQAKFRFVKSDEVAKRWGSRKGNTKMTYEKLSRAMRYYYKSKIFQPVLGRRLVYQFGPNAKGWETENPNFRH